MRKLLLIACLFFVSQHLLAQKLLLSEKESFNVRNDDFYSIGKYHEDILTYVKHNNKHELLFFDISMQLKNRLSLDFLPSNAVQIQFFSHATSLLLFYEVKVGKNIATYAAALQVDSSFTQPLLVMENKASVSYGSLNSKVQCSENGKFAVVSGITYENDFLTIKSVVYNQSLKEIHRVEQIVLEDTWEMSDAITISNSGEVFWVAMQRASKQGITESCKLLRCNLSEEKFLLYDISLENHAVSDLNLLFQEDAQLIHIIGTYSSNVFNDALGFYSASYDLSNDQFLNVNFLPIKLTLGKKGQDMKDLKLKYVGLKKDGGFEAIMEKTYQNVRTISAFNSSLSISMGGMMDNSRTVNEFYYDEIAIFNVDAAGKLAWSQTVLKSQMTSDDNGIFSSFGLFEHKIGKVYLFNDNNLRSNRLIAAYLSSKGQLNLKELPLTENMNSLDLLPRSSLQISSSEMLIPCLGKGYLRFLKVQF